MKRIILTGPSVRNGGAYVDAGETVEVGGGKTQIADDRAKELLDRGGALTETAAKAAEPGAGAKDETGSKTGQ